MEIWGSKIKKSFFPRVNGGRVIKLAKDICICRLLEQRNTSLNIIYTAQHVHQRTAEEYLPLSTSICRRILYIFGSGGCHSDAEAGILGVKVSSGNIRNPKCSTQRQAGRGQLDTLRRCSNLCVTPSRTSRRHLLRVARKPDEHRFRRLEIKGADLREMRRAEIRPQITADIREVIIPDYPPKHSRRRQKQSTLENEQKSGQIR